MDPVLTHMGSTVSVCLLISASMIMLAMRSISSNAALYFAVAFGATAVTWTFNAFYPQSNTVSWTLLIANVFGCIGMTSMWCGLWLRSGRSISRPFMSALMLLWLVPVFAIVTFKLNPGTHVPYAVLSVALGVISSAWFMYRKPGNKNAGDWALTGWLLLILPMSVAGLVIGLRDSAIDTDAAWLFYLSFLPTLFTGVGLFSLLGFTLEAITNSDALARQDGLTGLHNRRAFDSELGVAVARAERYQRDLSLIILDIDHFKALNDTYGHPAGDAVLRAVGRVLVEGARRIDIIARIGGEEFALILADTPPSAALRLADRLREAIAKASSESISFSASFGVADVEHSGYSVTELFSAADQAMYEAKQSGRNCVRYADDPEREPTALMGIVK